MKSLSRVDEQIPSRCPLLSSINTDEHRNQLGARPRQTVVIRGTIKTRFFSVHAWPSLGLGLDRGRTDPNYCYYSEFI